MTSPFAVKDKVPLPRPNPRRYSAPPTLKQREDAKKELKKQLLQRQLELGQEGLDRMMKDAIHQDERNRIIKKTYRDPDTGVVVGPKRKGI